MNRRRPIGKRRKSSALFIKITLAVAVLGGIAWTGATIFQLWQKVDALPEVKGHDFIAHQSEAPVLVIAQQSAQAAQLESLIILKADFNQRTIVALELPTGLTDSTTSVGQYLESHYYKEMQLAIESQLALPLSGYVIQPRSLAQEGKTSLVPSLNLHSPPSWWYTTVGLPFWLKSKAAIATNLSEWELLQLAWLIRDLELGQADITQVPASAVLTTDEQIQLAPDLIDPVIQDLFISDNVKGEAMSIVVKNATHVDGLAALASRFVANMGGEVVAVEPADTAQTDSSITAEKASSLTQSINQFLGIPTTIQPQSGRERADVELVIGTDALARLGK